MKNRGQCLLSCCPLRAEASDRAEMVSQLLFGECYSILETKGKWLRIALDEDGYEGWLSANQHGEILFAPGNVQSNEVLRTEAGNFFPMGCSLPAEIASLNNEILPPEDLAFAFLKAPYLWGGKTFMGVDCSGLIQVIFKANGVQLPRDANQQVLKGEAIEFSAREKGDLAFFHNDANNIIHVGILLSVNRIIHASGSVKQDVFDVNGILNIQTMEYSHHLSCLRRMR